MHRFHLLKIKVLGFIRLILASHICSTNLIPWVHHSREEGSLDYDGGFVRLQVHSKFNTNIYRKQAPFSGAVAGEQVIKIRSLIAFCVIFSFLLVFLFASTNF
jgi:hypothetical protein